MATDHPQSPAPLSPPKFGIKEEPVEVPIPPQQIIQISSTPIETKEEGPLDSTAESEYRPKKVRKIRPSPGEGSSGSNESIPDPPPPKLPFRSWRDEGRCIYPTLSYEWSWN